MAERKESPTDIELLEFAASYYCVSDNEEAHAVLADIVFESADEETSYEECIDENDAYVMPDEMREFALDLYENAEDDDELDLDDFSFIPK